MSTQIASSLLSSALRKGKLPFVGGVLSSLAQSQLLFLFTFFFFFHVIQPQAFLFNLCAFILYSASEYTIAFPIAAST